MTTDQIAIYDPFNHNPTKSFAEILNEHNLTIGMIDADKTFFATQRVDINNDMSMMNVKVLETERDYNAEIENITKNSDRQIANLIAKIKKDEEASGEYETEETLEHDLTEDDKCNDYEEAIEMLV